jgi:cobalamin biosynthesis Mg chelatase CobN
MNPKDSNRLRDKIIEIIESRCFADDKKETPTPLAAVYPLLHFFEAELHEYGKHLQGKVLDLESMLEMTANANKELKERYDSAIIEGDLLRTKNEELQERIIECESDYQDICDLAGQLALPIERQSIFDAVGRENYDRFKNHIGW